MHKAQQLASQMATDETITVTVQDPELQSEIGPNLSINLREDTIQLFEDESGRQYLQTEEMNDTVYIAPVPSMDGFKPELVIEPEFELIETEPAKQNETESPSIGNETKIRMD